MSDCISRQAVLDIINNPLNIRLDEIIKKLPSVTLTQNCVENALGALDCISRQAVLDGIEELKKSPWATDKRGNGFEYLIAEALDVVADLCVKQALSVNPQEPKTDALDNILREIEIEETLSDDKPNTVWAIGYKQGLQTVRRIVERYKAESEE